MARQQRRLAAIVSADVVGYSRLMQADEAGTHARLRTQFRELVRPKIEEFGGRVVKLMGDGLLGEFQSIVDAAEWAIAIQGEMATLNRTTPPEARIEYRIGVNLGDVIVDGDDLYGDGVNVAARLQEIAAPNGICLSDAAFQQVRGKVAADFAGGGEVKLKNLSEPIRTWRWAPAASDDGAEAEPSKPVTLALPDRPSIAVLPFNNMSGDPEQDYFADGMVEDIITTLSKLPGLLVVARNSTSVYKDRPVDVKQVGAEQGVRYVLEGSIRRVGDRIRVTAQLIDASGGHHLWADRYDRKVDDIFAVQDEITLKIVTELQIELLEGEMARIGGAGTDNVEAWSDQVRAVACTHVVTKDSYSQARRLAERAAAADPDYAPPRATLGYVHWVEGRLGWSDSREASIAKARDYATEALTLDPQNPEAHGVLGAVHMIEGDHAAAIAELETALDLSPNHANLAAYLSVIHSWNGEPEIAINLAEKAMRLSPFYPAWYQGALGFALRLAGRYGPAVEALREFARRQRGAAHVDLAIIYATTDRDDAARREAEEILRHRPEFRIGEWARTQMYRDPAGLERDVAALRRAGLPE